MEKKEREIAVWNLHVPKPLDEALDKFIASNFHMTKAEYIREAVRDKLERAGVKHVERAT